MIGIEIERSIAELTLPDPALSLSDIANDIAKRRQESQKIGVTATNNENVVTLEDDTGLGTPLPKRKKRNPL